MIHLLSLALVLIFEVLHFFTKVVLFLESVCWLVSLFVEFLRITVHVSAGLLENL